MKLFGVRIQNPRDGLGWNWNYTRFTLGLAWENVVNRFFEHYVTFQLSLALWLAFYAGLCARDPLTVFVDALVIGVCVRWAYEGFVKQRAQRADEAEE